MTEIFSECFATTGVLYVLVFSVFLLNQSGTNKNKSSTFRKVKRSNLLADFKRVEKKNLKTITKKDKDENAQARTGCGCCCNGKHEHDHCHKEEECCCHCHHGHHEECCNHCHHGHHHGFIHEWGYEEGGEHHGHIGCEDCHHCHEHCHEHSHHDNHHHQNHCHHEPDCCCGWGKKHSLPDSPIAFHCRDIIAMKDKKILKRFCLPVGYAGFSLPYQQAYPSVGLNIWGWGSPWMKNNILGNNATNANKTKQIKKQNKNEKSLKQKRNIYVDYDGNREENFIRGYEEKEESVPSACDADVCPFYNENTDLLQRRSGIIGKKEDEVPYERGITKRYFQGMNS